MADILCPHCGMPNPDDQNICSFCRQPLHIVADDQAIRPGDMPTKKNTAELEPILPQWLKEARHKARQNAEEDQAGQEAEEAARSAEPKPPAEDWLAGLEAAAKEDSDEDIPDWMRSVSPAKSAAPAPTREQPPKIEETFPRRQEISWEEDPPTAPRQAEAPPPTGPLGAVQSEDGIPYWLKNAQPEAPALPPATPKAESPAPTSAGNVSPFESGTFRPNTGELLNWLDKMSPQVGEPAPSLPSADQPASEPLPDWISKLDSESPTAEESTNGDFNFDWLKEEASKPFAPFQPTQAAPENAPSEEPASIPASLADWMKPVDASSQAPLDFASLEPAAEPPAPAPQEDGITPDWLNAVSAQSAGSAAPASDLPDWISALPVPLAEEPKQESTDLPDWMRTFASESSTPASTPTSEGISLPDWMSSATEAPASPKLETPPPPTVTPPAAPSTPAFLPGQEPVSAEEASELFAVDMPDWLSGIAPSEPAAAANSPKAESSAGDSISPAELPSWVQAMRPVEAALPGVPAMQEPASHAAELQGPLAGLSGVLPFIPAAAAAGKSKTYSIRLEPSADQQQQAALLEQMLENETRAKPMHSDSHLLGAQRILRWVVTAVLALVILFSLLGGSQLTPLPANLIQESYLALDSLNSVPSDAPVLVVFAYEPALSGELESTASFVNHLTTLRNPRYSTLAVTPTGAALAQRFFERAQIPADRVTHLGYLPGESAGILSFAVNPRAMKPLALDVTAYSDYALVLLVTDRAEAARAWVEQTAAQRNGRPLIVLSSAQAAPMIQPYLISGQVNGLVSGLHGGAEFEDESARPAAARRYWDAYNFSLLAVIVMIFFGGLWNFALGLRDRRQEQADA